MFKKIAILVIMVMALYANATNAETDWDGTKYEFRWMHVPVVCGTAEEVGRYINDNNFKLESVSIGREGAKADGNPAYWVAYYIKEDGTESISAITSPTGSETCMMYRSFDLRLNGEQT